MERPRPSPGSTTVKFDASSTRGPKGGPSRLVGTLAMGTAVGEKMEHTYARGGKYREVVLTAGALEERRRLRRWINRHPRSWRRSAAGRRPSSRQRLLGPG